MASDSIERTTCVVSGRDFMPVSPDIPVNITSIVILEFGLTRDLLSRTTLPGPFDDGESFEFTSIIGTEAFEDNDAVQIFQIAVNGLNENQVAIRNSLGIVYTNACGVQPIVTVGDNFGWIVFVSSMLKSALYSCCRFAQCFRISCCQSLTLPILWMSCVRHRRPVLR